MADRGKSPKRVRILASINPLDDDEMADSPAPPPEDVKTDDRAPEDGHEPRSSRFRFKSASSSKSRRRSGEEREEDGRDRRRRRERSRRHRHARPRRSPSPPRTTPPPPSLFEDGYEAKLGEPPPPLDTDAAFRESLFDAMADDEGASYWEGVYGQPVHVYGEARERVNARGELERMTDDEYAAYVRQRMWEKTHAGLLEARERRAREREARERADDEARRIHAEMERSLRRGEERRRRSSRRQRWCAYAGAWAGWDGSAAAIPWPVESSDRADIGQEAVRSFFVHGLGLEELGEKDFAARLKEERVRWHPDKMQQKLGGQVDDIIMKDVTAIFQIIDQLWADTRGDK